jgi:hypothetical protein
MEHAIDQQYCEMIKERKSKGLKKHRQNTAKQLSKNLASLDYDLPPIEANGPSHRGITALQGGDHGNVAIWIHYQFHLSSPKEKKARGSPNYACLLTLVAFAEYKKDKLELLDGGGMMQGLEESRQQFVISGAITVYSKTNASRLRIYLVPNDIDTCQS